MSISRINNNIAAVIANRNIESTGSNLQTSIERLASGLRINRAGDDAAGMTVATRLRSQVTGLNRAILNAQDGINLINVAEGALEEITVRLNRMQELAIQAGNTGVNDPRARQALQDEVFQSIDEINRIAETTQYSTNKLLDGNFQIKTDIKLGQGRDRTYGVHIDQSPTSNTLTDGESYLNIVKVEEGYQQIIAGEEAGTKQTINTGIADQTDIAVSLGLFTANATIDGGAAPGTTALSSAFFQGVSLYFGDTIAFQGVLADGVTPFAGAFSVDASTINDLVTNINNEIEAAERSLYGVATTSEVPQSFRITAAFGSNTNEGRIILQNSTQTFSQASISLFAVGTSSAAGELIAKAEGVTRGVIGEVSVLSGSGRIGNAVTAITGSTFDTGQFTITVDDVVGAQQRVAESVISWTDQNGSILSRTASLGTVNGAAVINGAFINGIYTGGVTLLNNSTVTLTGTETDGTTFEATFTLDASLDSASDTVYNDFAFGTVNGLIEELNYRTRSYAGAASALNGEQTRFELSQFTYTDAGTIKLVDDVGITDSESTFTLTFRQNKHLTDPAAESVTIQDDAVLRKEGFAESATFRVNGGESVRAEAGDVIALYGPESAGEEASASQVTLRVGSGFSIGSDVLEVQAQEFVGRLNGGPAVTFRNGDQDVVFIDPGVSHQGVARQVTVDFDAVLDITKGASGEMDPGTTLILSTVNRSMNFHIGAFSDQNFRVSLGDLRASNLGFGEGSGRAVEDMDVTTVSGVNEALKIIQKALDQVNQTRSLLGAATNRLESAIANLSVSVENLTGAESRIRDVDIARESSEFTKNQLMLQAGTSVLAQANFIGQAFLALLG